VFAAVFGGLPQRLGDIADSPAGPEAQLTLQLLWAPAAGLWTVSMDPHKQSSGVICQWCHERGVRQWREGSRVVQSEAEALVT
jgi:hypothetical protein